MRLDVGLPTEIVTAGSDSNVSVCIRLGVEAIQRNCYNETNNNNKASYSFYLLPPDGVTTPRVDEWSTLV